MERTSTGWVIRRNCSASPRQLAAVFASLAAVSFGFGLVFAARGLWLVLPFVGLELLALALAFVVCGRHAVDCERVTLADGRVTVERIEADRCFTWSWPLPWARVDLEERGSGLGLRTRVWVGVRDDRVEVGRHLPADQRSRLARELRQALRTAPAA